eukprot:1517412-Rhodomonas_salina.1
MGGSFGEDVWEITDKRRGLIQKDLNQPESTPFRKFFEFPGPPGCPSARHGRCKCDCASARATAMPLPSRA